MTTVKPGSHMPPRHLPHGRRYYLGYFSDMRTEVACNIGHPGLNRRHACEVNSSYVADISAAYDNQA